ncbi:hypothetical protein PIROE2DRAFT_14828 [Piromyces sp. E2]|nr:hypothetical protein PIROE2DRAFT_14828 [Piromyces sp. E2]|eukprot:OUM59582.1 hypothetical protein PIROE2DRAFT_14828 [Piromyces sp. E2]
MESYEKEFSQSEIINDNKHLRKQQTFFSYIMNILTNIMTSRNQCLIGSTTGKSKSINAKK